MQRPRDWLKAPRTRRDWWRGGDMLPSLGWLGLVAGACLAGITIVAVVFYVLRVRAENWVEHSQNVVMLAQRAMTLAVDRQSGLRGYLITRDVRNLQPERAARDKLPQLLDSLVALTTDDTTQHRRATDLRSAIARWDREFAAPILAGHDSASRERLVGKVLFDGVRLTFRVFHDSEMAIYEDRRHYSDRLRTTVAGVFILEACLFATIFLLAYARANQQSRELSTQYQQLAEQAVEYEMQSAELQEQSGELMRSETRYRILFDSLAVGVIMQSADGLRMGNAVASQVLGVPQEQLVSRRTEDRSWRVVRRDGSPFPSELLPGVLALRTGRRQAETIGIVRADNTLVWIAVTAQPIKGDSDGRVAEAIVSFIDITAQLKVEESFRESSALMQAVVQASPAGIIALDDSLNVTSWNAGAERIFGWAAHEVVGKRYPLVPPDQWNVFLEQRQLLLSRNLIADEHHQRLRKDGSLISVSMSAAVLRTFNGASNGIVIVALDLSERERLETDLRQAQKMEAIGQLAGGVAHDFNNLLTVILSYSQMHLNEAEPGSVLADDLREISDAARRAAGLTRQLLTFSRRQLLAPSEVSLNDVLTGISPMLARLLGSPVRLTVELAPDLWPCFADRGQLEQVIMNLAMNARDAMPNGGALAIHTRNVEVTGAHERVEIGMAAGSYVVLCVRDKGTGMDESTRSHIFEPFFTTKPAGEGTGLGLATVYGIVKQSGGFIDVKSTLGLGTEFLVYLPKAVGPIVQPERPAESAGDPEAASANIEGPSTILVVEDLAAIRLLSRVILERHGHTVIEAEHGEAALRVLESSPGVVDLVISDIEMPQMGGLELMRRLGEQHPTIPIMLVSGYSEELLLKRGMLSNRVAFLEKPYTPKGLLDAVAEVQRRARRVGGPAFVPLELRRLVAIVDDAEINRVLASALLDDQYRILSHAGGETTIDDLAARAPALILLDIDMPMLNGFEILRRIRLNPVLSSTPVIAFTARSSAADRTLFTTAGFDDYIGKPLSDFDAFRSQVESHLQVTVPIVS